MDSPVSDFAQDYGIGRWGDGYFAINPRGNVSVRPAGAAGTQIDLRELATGLRDAGLRLPVLLRFDDILRHRVRRLCGSFREVAAELGYAGSYHAIYPVKVNQQRSVVDALVAGGGDCFGLEAGSKPELMAVLASSAPGGIVVCNGYKDEGYVRLALLGRRMGFRVIIVLEKPDELRLVRKAAADLGIDPELGVRVRLAAVASGKWQNSGGARSKFGLSPAQLLAMVRDLRARGEAAWLTLLHSHIGSQIPDLVDIQHGMREVARYFAALRGAGVPLQMVDVGGGLGVDYEGTASEHYCSLNYGLADYARAVMAPLADICHEQGLPMPGIFSESGRALTAHHAVLLTEVIARESPLDVVRDQASVHPDGLVGQMAAVLRQLRRDSALPAFRRMENLLREAQQSFAAGTLDLAGRGEAERLYYAMAQRVRDLLHPESRRHRELLDRLNEQLADRVFCNFSVFQSMPDVWAIDQVFPVMPLQRLDEEPSQAGMLHDLTCDSDGCLREYVDRDGVESTLPLHPPRAGEHYLLGIFLVGAYQEILGDMHNLFGDTDAVNVSLDDAGGYRFAAAEPGDSVEKLLRYVHYDPDTMLARYRERIAAAGLGGAAADACYHELEAGLYGYTYLE